MSSPVHRAKDLDPALMYAPPRVRDHIEPFEPREQFEPPVPHAPPEPFEQTEEFEPPEQFNQAEPFEQTEPMPTMPNAASAQPIDWPWKPRAEIGSTFSGDHAVLAVQRRLALDPEWLPEPPRPSREGWGLRKSLVWMCSAAGAAALVAWGLVSPPGVALFENENARAAVLGITNLLSKQIPPTVAAAARPQQLDPRRGVAEAMARAPKDQSQVSKSVTSVVATAGAFMPAPAAMAMPAPAAMAMPAPAANAMPPPMVMATAPQPAALPPAAVPRMPPAAVLQAPPVSPAPPAATVPTMIIRPLDADERASLIKRGEDLINSGDLSSARLALRRAAEAGDARAALMLAGTYDPNLLDRLGFQEHAADIAQARLWYQRAQQFGSAEAPRRLQQLAIKTNSDP